jgi:hypothetical protein
MPEDSFTNTRDTLLQIINSTLTMTTREVIRDIGFIVFTSDNLEKVLNRFQVQSILHCKNFLLSRSTERLGYQAVNDTDSSLQLPLVDVAALIFTGAARAFP